MPFHESMSANPTEPINWSESGSYANQVHDSRRAHRSTRPASQPSAFSYR